MPCCCLRETLTVGDHYCYIKFNLFNFNIQRMFKNSAAFFFFNRRQFFDMKICGRGGVRLADEAIFILENRNIS